MIKETSEKSGETPTPLKSSEVVVIYEATVKTFLEVFTELGKGYP
jgi:hypothetical protein